MMHRVGILGAILATAPGTPPAQAQAEIGLDLELASSYVWRGITMTNRPVAKPAVYVALPVGAASLTVGGWSNIDLGRYDDLPDQIAEGGGSSALNLAEFDPYAEASFPVGSVTITAGIIGYFYPNEADAPNSLGLLTREDNTAELYGKVAFDSPFSPELSIFYDIDKVEGAYIEAGASYSIPTGGAVSLDVGAVAGFSSGQGDTSADLGEASRFDDDGLTHLDLFAGIPFTVGALSIAPAVHLVVNVDERTKITSPAHFDRDLKLWAGVSLSLSSGLGEESEDTRATQ